MNNEEGRRMVHIPTSDRAFPFDEFQTIFLTHVEPWFQNPTIQNAGYVLNAVSTHRVNLTPETLQQVATRADQLAETLTGDGAYMWRWLASAARGVSQQETHPEG